MTNPANLLRVLVPEAIVVCSALLALFLDVSFTRNKSNGLRHRLIGSVAVIGCALAIAWIAQSRPAGAFSMVDLVAVTPLLKGVLLALTIVTALLSFDTKFTRHVGEFYALLLLATTGLM